MTALSPPRTSLVRPHAVGVSGGRVGLHPATTATALAVCAVLSTYAWLETSPTAAILSALLLQVTAAVWGFRARPFGLPLAFYTFTTFTFLTGRIVVVGLLGFERTDAQPWGLHETAPDVAVTVLLLVQAFTASIFLSTIALRVRRHARGPARARSVLRSSPTTSMVALGAMLLGAPLYLQNRLSFVGSISSAGYAEFYLAQDELVTPTGRLGGSLLLVGFAFLLASLPRWGTFLTGAAIIVACHGVNLVMGRRADFVLTALLALFYVFLRARTRVVSPAGRRIPWPSDRVLPAWSLMAVPFIFVLDLVGQNRNLPGPSAPREGSTLLGFFYDQGVTANILGFLATGRFPIPHDRFYTFGPLIEFVQARLIPGFDATLYQSQSAERALEGYQFADAISFLAMPTAYLQGQGYGSSAVAELYWDGGPLWVILGGAAIAVLLALISRAPYAPLPAAAFLFLVFRDLIHTPRASFLYWLVGSLNVYNLAVFAALLAAIWLADASIRAARSRGVL